MAAPWTHVAGRAVAPPSGTSRVNELPVGSCLVPKCHRTDCLPFDIKLNARRPIPALVLMLSTAPYIRALPSDSDPDDPPIRLIGDPCGKGDEGSLPSPGDLGQEPGIEERGLLGSCFLAAGETARFRLRKFAAVSSPSSGLSRCP